MPPRKSPARARSAASATRRTSGSATKTASTKAANKKNANKKTAARKASSRRSASADALELLKADHRQVETLFNTFEGLGPRAKRSKADVADKVIKALSKHAAIEEQVFYPEVRRVVAAAHDDVLEALEEHHVVEWTLSELQRMTPDDERFTAKFTVLMENVRHHVKEEERQLFPQVRKGMSSDQLQELGNRLRDAKEIAPSRPHPRSPDTPPGNLVAAALTAPLDAAANVAESAAERVRDLVT